MANEDANVLPKSYPMVGADGPLSYTKNSQIQRGVVDGANELCTGFVKEVVEAYFGQFKIDMESFLNARAEELVPGGLLIILRSTLPNGVHFSNTFKGKLYDLLGSCLNDMAKMGLISEEKVDSFNFPIYYPSPEEFEAVIQRNGKFTIEKTSLFIIPMKDIALSIQFGVSQVRAVYEGVIQQHFGNELADQVFNYFNTKFEENIFTILEEKCDNRVELFHGTQAKVSSIAVISISTNDWKKAKILVS
ncbi:hypothetical protein Patl1_21384 [Pistacia atlantica]|uniref:Uncharacterized protein n=1 Tax=Pistacia atlantica TaxID=434234 RepID=A0ACC1BHZ4_9ROSI|nr:hypothetical protein Patl1_21384 [Pistacia atlantica]